MQPHTADLGEDIYASFNRRLHLGPAGGDTADNLQIFNNGAPGYAAHGAVPSTPFAQDGPRYFSQSHPMFPDVKRESYLNGGYWGQREGAINPAYSYAPYGLAKAAVPGQQIWYPPDTYPNSVPWHHRPILLVERGREVGQVTHRHSPDPQPVHPSAYTGGAWEGIHPSTASSEFFDKRNGARFVGSFTHAAHDTVQAGQRGGEGTGRGQPYSKPFPRAALPHLGEDAVGFVGVPLSPHLHPSELPVDIEAIIEGRDTRTTLMLRNIPNKYNSDMLLAELDAAGYSGRYDFFYLPIDFSNQCNVGYAFLNIPNPLDIVGLYKRWNGQSWPHFASMKRCVLAYARIQGRPALISRFQRSLIWEQAPASAQPMLFCTDGPLRGERELFPMLQSVPAGHGPSDTYPRWGRGPTRIG